MPTATPGGQPWPAWMGDLSSIVSAALAGLALLVTLWLLARDRRNADRQQVDHLGMWLEPLWLRKPPDESERLVDVKVQASIKNANHVPLRIVQMACQITTSWMVPDDG